jgi:hypothetical protein
LLHLLDANVLINANRQYYPLDRVPEFWEWLLHWGAAGLVKVPTEIVEEICAGTDDLAEWMSDLEHRAALELNEEAEVELVSRVIDEGYAPDLDDEEIEVVGRDPFLMAYALRNPGERCVVTAEVSRPARTRANRHIPDVCAQFGIQCMDGFGLVRSLNFRTAWRNDLVVVQEREEQG